MIAPNGKQSKLTPEQYKLVRTPAFKEWFGDWENDPENASKVVDENGEPLVVYHGTSTDFNIFKIGRTGGIFFTNNKNSAERFSIGDLKRLGENPKILQCFLNIRKYYEKNTNDEILINEYYNDYFENRPFISKSSQKNILKNKYNRYFMDLVSFGIVNEEPKQKLISYNYKGIIIDANNNSKSYIVFEPNQIKLADGTNTTFDSSNNDIRYKRGGNINFKNNNMSKHKDGLFVGKSHKEGGIPMVVKSTGQRIEVEGGESITNKTSMADTKRRTLTGTNCEIISQINTQNGNGVAMDCDSVVGKKYEYKTGGSIDNIKVGDEIFARWTDSSQWTLGTFKGETKNGFEVYDRTIERPEYIEFYPQISKLPYPYGDEKTFYSKKFKDRNYKNYHFIKEIQNSNYKTGGWILVNSNSERTIGEYETESEARQMMYEYDGDSFVMKKSELEKEKLKKTYREPAPINPATYIGMKKGGQVSLFDGQEDFFGKKRFAGGGSVTNYKLVNFKGNYVIENDKYYVVDETKNDYLIVNEDNFNRWLNADKFDRVEYYSEWIPKSEMVEIDKMSNGGSVSAKEIEDWRKYVLSNSSWFDNESDDSVEITLTTRENGDTYNEKVGQKDIDEAKYIFQKIKLKFPKTQGKIERVDEYVYLYLKPSKSNEELEEEKRIETTRNQEQKSAKIISEKLNFSKEKAFDVVERLRYSKQYYEQYKNEKADRYNNSFRVYFQEGTPSNIKFNNAEEVFDYITKDDFIKSIYNRSNPRNKVQIGLYGWDSLLIKYDNDGFGVSETGRTDWSKRTKILQIFPYIESNIQNQEDFINKVKKAISEFILCYKIYVLNDYQEEKKVIAKPKKDLKTQKQAKDMLSNFSIIDKKIMGLKLALRVANKEDEKLIERRIKALEIANKTQVYADLNENEIKVLKAISISSKGNGGDFTYFDDVMKEINKITNPENDLTQQQLKGYISKLKQKQYIAITEDEFSQIYAGKYHDYLTDYKFNN